MESSSEVSQSGHWSILFWYLDLLICYSELADNLPDSVRYSFAVDFQYGKPTRVVISQGSEKQRS